MYFIKKGGVDMLKREDIIAMAKDAKVEFIRLQFTDIPVSYTHLDVYKRQPLSMVDMLMAQWWILIGLILST